jgi:hypothetical protein
VNEFTRQFQEVSAAVQEVIFAALVTHPAGRPQTARDYFFQVLRSFADNPIREDSSGGSTASRLPVDASGNPEPADWEC